MDGIELQRRIKLQRPALPVILMSAHDIVGIRKTAFDEGAAAFLYKPFDATDLLDVVRSALSKAT